MNNMVNIAEILKDAPYGLKLYSLVHGYVTLRNVDTIQVNYPIEIIDQNNESSDSFTKDGKLYYDLDDAECILFPSKEHKSWNEWQLVLFDIGNFVTDTRNNESYILTDINQNSHTFTVMNARNIAHDELPKYFRYATQEEKNKVSHELTMSKLRFNLETQQFERTDINDIKEKRFSINDLHPFDKVLTRNSINSIWCANYYSHKVESGYICVAGFTHSYCIPYNDETSKLLGTKNDCPKKYKTW